MARLRGPALAGLCAGTRFGRASRNLERCAEQGRCGPASGQRNRKQRTVINPSRLPLRAYEGGHIEHISALAAESAHGRGSARQYNLFSDLPDRIQNVDAASGYPGRPILMVEVNGAAVRSARCLVKRCEDRRIAHLAMRVIPRRAKEHALCAVRKVNLRCGRVPGNPIA